MTWEYGVIGLVIGLALGFIIMYPSVRKNRQQQDLQQELEKSKHELEQYRQELVNHFARSAELLKSMANDYHQLHQHMINSSSVLLSDNDSKIPPPAIDQIDNVLTETAPEPVNASTSDEKEQPPRDYSDGPSGLLRSRHVEQ